MNRVALDILRRFHQTLGQCRMGMDHLGHLGRGRTDLHRQSRFMHQVGGMGPKDVHAENFPAR